MALPATRSRRTILVGAAPRRPARRDEVDRIRRLLERLHSPRLQMTLLVALTGAVGFIASTAMLYGHVDRLWVRYPVAVVIAYGAFLFFLWVWIRSRTNDVKEVADFALEVMDPPLPDPFADAGGRASRECGASEAELRATADDIQFGGGEFGGGGASGSFAAASPSEPLASASESLASGVETASSTTSEAGSTVAKGASSVLDGEELALVLVAIAALAGALWAAVWMVWAAPLLLAELLFDVALAAGLYRRLRGVEGRHWLRTAVKRTALPFAAIAVLLSVAGGVLQHLAPDARSIGAVVRHLDDEP